MNVRDLKEMLGRFDEDLRVTIGGDEYEGGACRLDRNGRVSIELDPKTKNLLRKVEQLEEDIESLEDENSKLEKELCQHESRRERVQDAIQAMTDAIEALKP